ncbi:hypothetical protein PPYR_14999, partial [Photinus pyralis]
MSHTVSRLLAGKEVTVVGVQKKEFLERIVPAAVVHNMTVALPQRGHPMGEACVWHPRHEYICASERCKTIKNILETGPVVRYYSPAGLESDSQDSSSEEEADSGIEG